MRMLLPLYGLLLAAFAAGVLFVFKVGLDGYVAANSLAAAQISAPVGWTSRPYVTRDGELITQTVLDKTANGATTQQILQNYEIVTGGLRGGALTTFERGDELMALRISFAPHVPHRASLAEMFGRKGNSEAATTSADGVFATVAGLPVIEAPRFADVPGDVAPMPVNYRYFSTIIGDQAVDDVLEVSVLTNSSDGAVVAMLGLLDIAVLNDRLPTPDPRVMAASGVQPRDALPLSDLPPRPTPAYRALELLDTGQTFDAPWQNALVQIRNGEIDTWDELHGIYPKIDTLPFQLLDVLADGSHDSAARYFAAILSNSGRAWTGHEFHVLSKVAEVGTTQADLAEYIAGDFDVAPEVLALAKRLPLAPDPAMAETRVVQSGVAPATGLGRAATCVMDNGVRRCIVGAD